MLIMAKTLMSYLTLLGRMMIARRASQNKLTFYAGFRKYESIKAWRFSRPIVASAHIFQQRKESPHDASK